MLNYFYTSILKLNVILVMLAHVFCWQFKREHKRERMSPSNPDFRSPGPFSKIIIVNWLLKEIYLPLSTQASFQFNLGHQPSRYI